MKNFMLDSYIFPIDCGATKVTKPVRLIFSIYSKYDFFVYFEYRFVEINDYSSIELIKTKN